MPGFAKAFRNTHCNTGCTINWGIAKLVKALDFDSSMRRFESFFPSHFSSLQSLLLVKLLSRPHLAVLVNSFVV